MSPAAKYYLLIATIMGLGCGFVIIGTGGRILAKPLGYPIFVPLFSIFRWIGILLLLIGCGAILWGVSILAYSWLTGQDPSQIQMRF